MIHKKSIWHMISSYLPYFLTQCTVSSKINFLIYVCFLWVGRGEGNKNTLHGYSQSDYHFIHLPDIHRSYFQLIYSEVCYTVKIMHNKNCLKYCIFHCRMLHFVFPYNNQYLISWKYLGCSLVVC